MHDMGDSEETMVDSPEEGGFNSQSGSPSILGDLHISKPNSNKMDDQSISSSVLIREELASDRSLKRERDDSLVQERENEGSSSPEYPPLTYKLIKTQQNVLESSFSIQNNYIKSCNSTQDRDSPVNNSMGREEFEIIEEYMSGIEEKIDILTKIRSQGASEGSACANKFSELKQKLVDTRFLLLKLNMLHQNQREELTKRSTPNSYSKDHITLKEDLFVLAFKQRRLLYLFKRYEELLGKAKSLKNKSHSKQFGGRLPSLQNVGSSDTLEEDGVQSSCVQEKGLEKLPSRVVENTINFGTQECVVKSADPERRLQGTSIKATRKGARSSIPITLNTLGQESSSLAGMPTIQKTTGPVADSSSSIQGTAPVVITHTLPAQDLTSLAEIQTDIVRPITGSAAITPTAEQCTRYVTTSTYTSLSQGPKSLAVTPTITRKIKGYVSTTPTMAITPTEAQATDCVAATSTTLGQKPCLAATAADDIRGAVSVVETSNITSLGSILTVARTLAVSASVIPTTVRQYTAAQKETGLEAGTRNIGVVHVAVVPNTVQQSKGPGADSINTKNRMLQSIARTSVEEEPFSSMPQRTGPDAAAPNTVQEGTTRTVAPQGVLSSSVPATLLSQSLLQNAKIIYVVNTTTKTLPSATMPGLPETSANTLSASMKQVPSVLQVRTTTHLNTSGIAHDDENKTLRSAVLMSSADVTKTSYSRPFAALTSISSSFVERVPPLNENHLQLQVPVQASMNTNLSRLQSLPTGLQTESKNKPEQQISKCGNKPPVDVNSLLRYKVIEPGRDVLSANLQGKKYTASLMANGSIQSAGGEIFHTPMAWLKAVMGSKTALRQPLAYNKISYKGKPLSSYCLSNPILQGEGADNTSILSSKQKRPVETFKESRNTTSNQTHSSRISTAGHRQPAWFSYISLNDLLSNNCRVRVISDNELIPTASILPADFWSTNFDNIDIDPKLFVF